MNRFVKKLGVLLLLTLGIPAVSQAMPLATAEDKKFAKLLDDQWEWLMQQYPTWATSIGGYEQYNGLWTDQSETAIAARKQYQKQLISKIEAVDRTKLSQDNKLSWDLFLYSQKQYLEGDQFSDELMPINQMGGIHQSVPRTLAMMPKRKVKDYDNMIARLRGVSTVVDQTIALMKRGLAAGITPPKITLRDIPDQVKNLLEEDPEKNSILTPFRDLPDSFTAAQKSRLKKDAAAALTKNVLPAFRKLHKFLEDSYLPGARTSIAMGSLPNGKAWYAHRVKTNTTLDKTPEQIHQLGLAEVKRIRTAMEKVIKEAKFKGSFAEFTKFLREDPQFYYTKPEDLIAGYRNISKKADYKLMELFGKLPRQPYGVVAVPFYAEKSQTTAYYRRGSNKDGRPGTFFANTYDLKSRPKWEMEALTLHEAVPGHHLQIALAQEQDDLPRFRKNGGYTAYIEGWGLYSESLGEEMGFYQDPYSKFGQLTYEMWRAIRLVVDTGMHHLGWSRAKAIEYFRSNTGKSEHDIVVEIDRYIVWPGQALAYKMGELKIKELRGFANAELGEQFDIRQFHDRVLEDGALPLKVLDQKIRNWVKTQTLGE